VSGWNADDPARVVVPSHTTIVEGTSFSVSATNGDIRPGTHHGAYFGDARFVSDWSLTVDGSPVEALSVHAEPDQAKFVGRAVNTFHGADTPLVVERLRTIGTGLQEDILVRNFSRVDIRCTLELRIECDFADLLAVKRGATLQQQAVRGESVAVGLRIRSGRGDEQHTLDVLAPDAAASRNALRYQVTVPARGSWNTSIMATPKIGDTTIQTGSRGQDVSAPIVPVPIAGGPALTRTLERSQLDLAALRITDPTNPGRDVVAAGSPWFMGLFGRDSILAAYMALAVDPTLALGTLQTLADYQGAEVDEKTEEQPGRILNGMRLGATAGVPLDAEAANYASADATPLFVTLLGELRRWGQDSSSIRALLPAADRALGWIERYGDLDGDGFVEPARLTPDGPVNQGWKDSPDSVTFADGTIAEGPITLCEVQGYVYSAYEARAYLAADADDRQLAAKWRRRAAALKRRFNERFWMPERGRYAIALDRDKSQVDSCASNIGHCLWSGIIDADKAPSVVEQLLSSEMFSGWGVRTLASSMAAYNPISYHNGSIWPHDNAIIVAGLMRYGFAAEARTVASAIFDVADRFDGRLPELFCGFDRAEYPEPVPYPTSCSPQAWAAAAPIQLIRSLARFDPDIPRNQLWLAPAFPPEFGRVSVTNLPLAGQRLDIDMSADEASVTGLPAGVRLHRSAYSATPSASARANARWNGRSGYQAPGL
jgi:glycogen debranching enzyme